MVAIRAITPNDAVSYWDLRLNALKNNPEAFSANYEDSANLTLDSVRTRIQVTEDHFILGAFHEDVIVGMDRFC